MTARSSRSRPSSPTSAWSELPAPDPADDRRARATTRVGSSATWFGRRYIERRLRVGQDDRRQRSAQALQGRRSRSTTRSSRPIDGAEKVLMAGRIVPGLPADGRSHRRAPAGGDPRGPRPGGRRLSRVPAAGDPARRGPRAASAARSRRPTTRRRFEGRDAALRRLAFDELLALQLGMVSRRRAAGPGRTRPCWRSPTRPTRRSARALTEALSVRVGRPVELTDDQAAAIADLRADLARPTPMLRLLQGDVGSGKTAVAAYALAAVARAGLQGALLAPTDLLARQHLETVGGAARGPRDRRDAADRLAQGRATGEGARRHPLRAGVGRRRARTR